MASPGTVIIAGHGPGRGRDQENYDALFATLARRHPDLASRLRHWRTGTPSPSLDDVVGVVFLLADPLRELYPRCYAEAVELETRARARGARLVNPPDTLSHTIKSRQAERWSEAGVPTPRVVGFRDAAELDAAASELGYPCIVRADHLHAHAGTVVLRSPADTRDLASGAFPYPGALAQLVDTRVGHTRGLLAEFHHKKRAFVFGDEVQPHHLVISVDPVVSLRSSVFRTELLPGKRSLLARWRRRRNWHAAIDADHRYFASAEPHAEVLLRAVHLLGLEFAAVDYATLGDGAIVLWEANPFFRFPTGMHGRLAGPRKLAERVDVYCDAFARFLVQVGATEV